MITIDASRYGNTSQKTGVEWYSFHLLNALVKLAPDEIQLVSPRRVPLGVPQIVIPFPRLWTLIRLSFEVLKNKSIKILFIPSHVLPLITPKCSVITIHDVAWKVFPQSYSFLSRLFLEWGTRRAVRVATKILTPSAATRDDLVRYYKADPEKIVVTPLGYTAYSIQHTATEFGKTILEKWGIAPKNYFCFIGRIETKKNTDTLIRAFSIFAEKNTGIKLVLAGFPGHGGQAILDAIPEALKPRIVLPGYVTEEQRTTLMQNALCFVFPSRYEGFGLPLLEAMHTQIPIIASNISASREVAGPCAHYFETENAEDLAKKMDEIAENPNLTDAEKTAMNERVGQFSWESCAQKTLEVLRSC